MDENALKESVGLLRSQLRNALEKAEKYETDLTTSNEAQARLLIKCSSLEQKVS